MSIATTARSAGDAVADRLVTAEQRAQRYEHAALAVAVLLFGLTITVDLGWPEWIGYAGLLTGALVAFLTAPYSLKRMGHRTIEFAGLGTVLALAYTATTGDLTVAYEAGQPAALATFYVVLGCYWAAILYAVFTAGAAVAEGAIRVWEVLP